MLVVCFSGAPQEGCSRLTRWTESSLNNVDTSAHLIKIIEMKNILNMLIRLSTQDERDSRKKEYLNKFIRALSNIISMITKGH